MTQTPEHAADDASPAPPASGAPRGRRGLIAAAILAGAFIGLAGVYGIGGLQRNEVDAACQPAAALAQRLAPLARGEVAAVTMAAGPFKLPELAFHDGAGTARTLADWRGRTVLLNLWATWCVPCRQEMPALDQALERFGGPGFDVVAVNIDTRNLDKPKAWLSEAGIKRLAYYADPSGKVFTDLKLAGRAFGMPTTLLIDPSGCEIGTIAGPAEWASEDAARLLAAALSRS